MVSDVSYSFVLLQSLVLRLTGASLSRIKVVSWQI